MTDMDVLKDATSTLPLAPGRWTLDPFHSRVGFAIRHLGVSKVRGHFARFEAELVVGADVDGSAVTASIAVDSIDTGNGDRDAHVLQPDLLDVATRPTLDFRSTRISGAGADWVLEGELTIGGETQPITLEVELGGVETFGADGSRHAGFEARGELRRKDFGIDFGPLAEVGLSDVVKLELDLQFVEPS